MAEMDRPISLLERLVQHAETTARYAVYFGEGRDIYDVRGRTAHESIFNVVNGAYRCPNSQQGYSPFTTWTRGLAWILCGYPEELEFLETRPESEFAPFGGKAEVLARFLAVAEATADFYIANTPVDGVPYWDTGAPGLARMGDYLDRPAEPFNEHEPVDSSAAAIAAQGLLRLGRYLERAGQAEKGRALLPGRPFGRRERFSASRIFPPTRITRACCFIPFITGRMAGTMCRRVDMFPAARPRCGAITTRANSRW